MHTQPLPSLRRRRPPFGGPSVRALLVLAGIALLSGVLWFRLVGTGTLTLPWAQRSQPSTPLQAHIVSAAQGQVGYRTSPDDTRCNKYSAYWGVGDATCGNANRSEQWCADFAAWVWQQGGAQVVYGQRPGQLNAGAVSFYRWGVEHGTWHPAGSRYTPQPGDVAVYGMNDSRTWAQHVAVVTSYQQGARGPDVINGDGTKSGFSVVEVGTNQYEADVTGSGAGLSGYVSPS